MSEWDPRVYFAAERTLLAWVRTGVTIIALGFVVARFGLFLKILNPAAPDTERMGLSGLIGVVLALFGGVLTALAGINFSAFLRHLKPEEQPRPRFMQTVSLVLAFAVTSIGVVLGVYMLA
jgi:putative membrane protein